MILKKATLSQQIFFSMIVLVSCSLLIVAIINIKQIQKDTTNYNIERLGRKDRAVAKSIEAFINTETHQNNDVDSVLQSILVNTGYIHKIKINAYRLDGEFITSSDSALLNDQIVLNPIPKELLNSCAQSMEKKTNYEKGNYIGTYRILYKKEIGAQLTSPKPKITNHPFCIIDVIYDKSTQNEYIEKRNKQIKKFIKIYLILFIISMIFGYILLKRITSPLRSISIHLSSVKIDSFSKLNWPVQDEIGVLIEEYNKLMNELEIRTKKLIKSEKEGAWKKMAKQIAHEIKNPLTPMRLNVQYLLKSFHDGERSGQYSDEWKQKLSNFSETMIQQIDTLNRIATSFSDFASLNTQKPQEFFVVEEIEKVVDLFKNNNVVFKSQLTPNENPEVFVDKSYLTRVLNNLITNSLQSVSPKREMRVSVNIAIKKSFCVISIEDNGVGISKEIQSKIFEPNFTTKNSGMGLGLAMVKKIIDDFKGDISYKTSDLGTVFEFTIPIKYKPK